MTARIKVLDKCVQDKINDCVENLREMQEIEIQLQQSNGIDPHITTLCTSDIDTWLKSWKKTRETNLEYYTCLLCPRAERFRNTKVAKRIEKVTWVRVAVDVLIVSKAPWYHNNYVGPSLKDANPSELQALYEEHLQDEIDLLEQYLIKFREKHRLLADQFRSLNL